MAQNVTIAGASYLGVPRIEMPKTGGGTAVFVDTSDANAAAGDITKGKTAYVGGTKITGTLEASSVSVQETKALTITSNGTVSVTPDAPYDALKKVDVTVNVASGGGGGSGFKVTFPATATNWNMLRSGGIVQVDGTVVNMKDYSTLAGKTIPNVLEICLHGIGLNYPRMTVQKGKIMVTFMDYASVKTTTAVDGESTITYMNDASSSRWIPLADTVISAIEILDVS